MATLTKSMSTNRHWKKISYNPSNYIDHYSLNLVNDLLTTNADYFDPMKMKIKQEREELSPSAYEAEQYPLRATSTNSPPTESPVLNLICRVCGAPAHGYNFDQITCESCKAFFRRNALKNTSNLKCRYTGSCPINLHTRRQCTYCRLKKCFDIKMRKEWIRTEEERELRRLKNLNKQQKKLKKLSPTEQAIVDFPIVIRKKKRILQPIKQEHVIQKIEPIYRINMFAIHRNLSDNDKILLNNIENAYKFGAEQADFSHIRQYTSSSSLSQFINNESVNHQSLIYFYKHISEFRDFDIPDQILLIKCNLVNLIHLHHIIIQNFHEPPQMAIHMSKWISEDFHNQMSQTRKKFDFFMKYPLVLKLALIVFVFSINLSTPRGSSQFMDYKNKRKLYEHQKFYLAVLWRYLNYLFNEYEAIKGMDILVMQILRYQTLMNKMDDILRENNLHQDIFNPLMQSIFGLT